MLRTKLSLSRILPGFIPGFAACCALVVTSQAFAGPPRIDGGMEPDYEASGFVVPAGYSEPSNSMSGGVVHANAPYGATPMYSVAPAGFFHGGSSMGCDTGMCDAGCDGYACGGGCGSCGGCGGCGLGLNDLRHVCIFCRGDGCGVCQGVGSANLMGCLAALAPYTEAGIGAQRWYDISAEALFLAMDNSQANFAITSEGIGQNLIRLSAQDAYNAELEAGLRLSASFICGAGGNIEVTYMGVYDWGNTAAAGSTDPNGPTNLYSFISNFGTAPPGGFDDTDNSLFQSVGSQSRFHSGEVNYRRRWVGPYSRFQGSWLAGIRYVDFGDEFQYQTIGLNNDTVQANDLRFFDSQFKASNSMTGFQLGGDLWWNITPGINWGLGLKGAILGNDAKMSGSINSNSIGPNGVNQPLAFGGVVRNSDAALLGELETTLVYRFSYSWSFRTSYYLIGIDDVALGASGLQSTTFTDTGFGVTVPTLGALSANDDLTIQGFSFGAEYLW